MLNWRKRSVQLEQKLAAGQLAEKLATAGHSCALRMQKQKEQGLALLAPLPRSLLSWQPFMRL